MQDERQKLAARMTPKAARLLLDLPLLRARRLEEMRFYAGQNACFIFDGRSETQHAFFSRQDVDELVTALCGYSRYAYETQLAQGFIPLEGGCRAGVCGRVTRDNDGAARLSSPTSVCIRMAREISGASEAVFPFLMEERRGLPRIAAGPAGMRQDDGFCATRQSGLRVTASVYRFATNGKNYSRKMRLRQGLT